jgi:hypothetical protein
MPLRHDKRNTSSAVGEGPNLAQKIAERISAFFRFLKNFRLHLANNSNDKYYHLNKQRRILWNLFVRAIA